MKKKFIIMTTAIIRPDLHNLCIKLFYDTYYLKNKEQIDNIFDIYHVINIDAPNKLKHISSQQDTINNFNIIIPDTINKIYITPDDPDFLRAFKNIMNTLEKNDLLSENNLYWWLEDDWILTKDNFDFFNVVNKLLIFNKCAITMTKNCPIGSFRGGPIMNGKYFLNHFNLVHLNIMNDTCDPECQVSKYLTSKSGISIGGSVKRKLIRKLDNVNDRIIKTILFYFDTPLGRVTADFCNYYNENKISNEITFEYHLVLINNYNYDEILYVNYKINNDITNINNYKKMSIDNLYNEINSDSITYIIIKPFIFEDCGREYAKQHELIKGWTKIGDKLTYS